MRRVCMILVLLALTVACGKGAPPPEPTPQQAPTGPLATVVLLADEEGKVGAVVVTGVRGDSVSLDQKNQAVDVDQDKRLEKVVRLDDATVQQRYGKVLQAIPAPPVTFVLYFNGKTARLTAQSKRELKKIGQLYRQRKSVDVSIVGHTDRRGGTGYNMRISELRAQEVAKLLFKQERIPWQSMEIASHGEAFPQVDTGDGRSKAVNQRVEVTIR